MPGIRRTVSVKLSDEGTNSGTDINGRGYVKVPLQFDGAITDVTLGSVQFTHVWPNVSAADRTNVFSIVLTSNSFTRNMSVALDDGDYDATGLCAALTRAFTTSYGSTLIDDVGIARTCTWVFMPDCRVTTSTTVPLVTMESSGTNRNGLIRFSLVAASCASPISISVTPTLLAVMTGMCRNNLAQPSARNNSISGNNTVAVYTPDFTYDLRHSSLRGDIHIIADGVEMGTVFAVNSVRPAPILATVPMAGTGFLQTVEYYPGSADDGVQPLMSSERAISLGFYWADGTAVNFSHSNLSMTLYLTLMRI